LQCHFDEGYFPPGDLPPAPAFAQCPRPAQGVAAREPSTTATLGNRPWDVPLWRGTVTHRTITHVEPRTFLSLSGCQAFTPCAIIAMDGLMVALAVLVIDGAEGSVARAIALAGGAVSKCSPPEVRS